MRGIFDLFAENAKIEDWLAEGSGFELSYMDPAPVASRSIDKGETGCIRIYGLCEELCDLLRAMMESARLVLIGITASSKLEGFVERE
jgi:hypothetical protein